MIVTYPDGARASVQSIATRVALVRFIGALTPATMHELRVDLQAHVEATAARGLVIDVRGATVDPSAWPLFVPAQGVRASLGVPLALVVAPELMALAQAHAWSMAQRGIVRGVFADVYDAMVWSQAKARLWPPGSQARPSERLARVPLVCAVHPRLHRACAPHRRPVAIAACIPGAARGRGRV